MGGFFDNKPAVQTTVQNTQTNPYAPAQGDLAAILAGARSTANSGVGSQVYGGPRVAGFGADSLAGQDIMRNLALGGPSAATQAGTNYATNTLANGGMSGQSMDALQRLYGVQGADLSQLQGVLNQYNQPNAVGSVANGLMGGAGDMSYRPSYSTEQNLGGVARGDLLGGANPYMNDIIASMSGDAGNAVKGAFSASGRYGSGNFAGAMAKATGDISSKLRYTDYENERARQASANQAIDSQRNAASGLGLQYGQANVNNRLSGANLGLAQTQQQLGAIGQSIAGQQANANLGLDQAKAGLTAGQNATNSTNQILSQLPMLEQLRQNPALALMQLGQLNDQNTQSQLTAQMQQFQEQQNAPWRQLGLYSGLVNPIASLGTSSTGTGTTTTTGAQGSPFQQLLGGGLLAAQAATPLSSMFNLFR